MSRMRIGLAAVLVFAVAVLTSGFTQAGTPKNQLVVGLNMVNITSLDPHNSNSTETSHFIANTYDNLIRVDPDDASRILPLLAERWEERADGTIVFHLRDDVIFHSGNKMTSADVEYSLRRAVKLGLLSSSYFVQWGYNKDNIDSKIYATDEKTVVMEPVLMLAPRLKLFLLARLAGAILDSKLIRENEKDGDLGKNWLASHEAGSGPYTMTRWNPNDVLILSANEKYWGGKAKLNRVFIRHLPESQVERLLLEKGDIDVAMQLVSADLDALSNAKGIVVERVPGTGHYYLSMSTRDPDFAKPLVRRAIRYAIDYDGILASVMKNYGMPTASMIPPGVSGYQPDFVMNVYDPEKAKALLAEAGYPNGLKKQLLVLSSSPYSELATVIQENLAKVGIQVELRTGNGEQTYGPMRNRNFEFGVGRTSSATPADPDGWTRTHIYNPDNSDEAKLTNLQGWRQSISVPEVNALIDEAAASSDEAVRAGLYGKAERLFEEAVTPFIPVARAVDPFARSAQVKNYKPSPIAMTRWNEIEKE